MVIEGEKRLRVPEGDPSIRQRVVAGLQTRQQNGEVVYRVGRTFDAFSPTHTPLVSYMVAPSEPILFLGKLEQFAADLIPGMPPTHRFECISRSDGTTNIGVSRYVQDLGIIRGKTKETIRYYYRRAKKVTTTVNKPKSIIEETIVRVFPHRVLLPIISSYIDLRRRDVIRPDTVLEQLQDGIFTIDHLKLLQENPADFVRMLQNHFVRKPSKEHI